DGAKGLSPPKPITIKFMERPEDDGDQCTIGTHQALGERCYFFKLLLVVVMVFTSRQDTFQGIFPLKLGHFTCIEMFAPKRFTKVPTENIDQTHIKSPEDIIPDLVFLLEKPIGRGSIVKVVRNEH